MPRTFDVHFGPVDASTLDWRTLPDDTPDDDAKLATTPADVVGLLGFDPLEFGKYNPNHDPDTGEFASGGGGGTPQMSAEDFQNLIAESKATSAKLRADVKDGLAANGFLAAREGDRLLLITRSTEQPGMLQVTNFYRGEPTGHMLTPDNLKEITSVAAEFKTWPHLTADEADAALDPATYGKFNPNHDPATGEFSSGDGGAKEAVAAPAGQSPQQAALAQGLDPNYKYFFYPGSTVPVRIPPGSDTESDDESGFVETNAETKARGDYISSKFARVGGDVIAYHGTREEVLANIAKDGIKAVQHRNFSEVGSALYEGARGESVFVAKDYSTAATFAKLGSLSGEPVILEVHIPESKWKDFHFDYEGSREFGASAYAPMTIPPSWIVKATSAYDRHFEQQGKEIPFPPVGKAGKYKTVYVVITVNPEVAKFNPNHDPATGEFSSGDGGSASPEIHQAGGVALHEEDGTAGAGTTFTVMRLGSADGTLANKNAGNANGVADHLGRIDDFEAPAFAGGSGDTISVYQVTLSATPGAYSPIVAGHGAGGDKVGRMTVPWSNGDRRIVYSFPQEGQGYTSKLLGRVSLSAVRNVMKERFDSTSADYIGTINVSTAIKEAVSTLAKANPYHDERGRFTSAPSGGGASETASSGATTLAEGSAGLKQYIDMVAGMHGDRPNAFKMLAEHGRAFAVDDKSFIGGKPQQCYMNATRAVWDDPSLTYVEGFVGIHGVPIAHAWTTDATGKVRDVTLGKGSAKMVTGYYGVPIQTKFLSETLLKSKVYGILTGGDNPRTVHAVVTADPAKVVAKA